MFFLSLVGDVCDDELVRQLFERHQFDAVVHLAAQAGVRHSIDHPLDYVRNNIECFVRLLEQLRLRPQVRLVYASSSSVYGSQARIPFALNDPADHQTSMYGVSKRTNELIARSYHHLYNISTTGLRFFTVYGEWGRPDMALYTFVENIEKGQPISVYGYGQMRRDFTHVDDISAGVLLALDHGGRDEIFNVGYGKPVLLDDFVTLLEKSLGKKAIKDMRPRNLEELPVTFCDTRYTTDTLGYHPSVSVDQGVARFVEWYRWYSSLSARQRQRALDLMATYEPNHQLR